MNIMNAEIISANKRARITGGLYIDFLSLDNIKKDDIVESIIDNSPHYFRVTDISIFEDNLKVKATETGYWTNYLTRNENLDLRNLIGEELNLITDAKKLAKIREEALYC